jgi:hypothetical protein
MNPDKLINSIMLALVPIKRVITLLLLCGLQGGCMIGWQSNVYIRPVRSVTPEDIAAVASGMKAVSVITTPPKNLSVTSADISFEVKRGNVVAVVTFPTFTVVKYDSAYKSVATINISTYSRSAASKAFVKDLADALQHKFGDPSFVPPVERLVNDGGP